MTRAGRLPVVASLVAGLIGTSVACGGAPEQEVPSMPADRITVTSPAFADGQPIPAEFTCDGAGSVPTVAWTGAPSSAAALALVMDDPDAPSGTFTHWVVLDLPPGTTGLTDGRVPAGVAQSRNSGGRTGWYPPCPPRGTHRYRFTVHALSQRTGLRDGVALDEALAAIRASSVAQGQLVGTYSRRR